jgi:hypothetical protein
VDKVDGKDVPHEMNRLSVFKEYKQDLDLPHVNYGAHLIEIMLNLPPTRPMPMGGDRATDWPEIQAYVALTERLSTVWEIETVHAMCQRFADGFARKDPRSYSPMEQHRKALKEAADGQSS